MTRAQKIVFYILATIGIGFTAAFGLFWFSYGHVPQNFHGPMHLFDVLLFLMLTYTIWHQIGTEVLLWLISDKMKKPIHRPPQPGMKVAFITTFVPGSESPELLHRILPALQRAHYAHDVWLLDEGNDPLARRICAKYGVRYFSRKGVDIYNTATGKFAARTKGGNHNAWYDAIGYRYDIVAQIDTDFIPTRDFLTRTLGYFRDPQVAFVTTPQVYGNEDDSLVAKGAAQQQFMFYGPILQGLYGQDMAMLLGANHIIRVAALKDIDYYGGHLTEDLLTGMTLHSKKWKSVYVPEALAIGEGPNTWLDYFNQQMRWAFGCIDILFHHTRKLVRTMLTRHGIYYLMMMQHYFTGLAMMSGVVLIALYLFFGINSAAMDLDQIILFYIPLIIWQFLLSLWLQRFNVRPREESGLLLSGKLISIAVWPIYFLALIGVIRGKQLKFKVTPKGGAIVETTPLRIFRPHIVIALITLLAFNVALIKNHENYVMLGWATLTVSLLLGIALASQMPEITWHIKRLMKYIYTPTPGSRKVYVASGRRD